MANFYYNDGDIAICLGHEGSNVFMQRLTILAVLAEVVDTEVLALNEILRRGTWVTKQRDKVGGQLAFLRKNLLITDVFTPKGSRVKYWGLTSIGVNVVRQMTASHPRKVAIALSNSHREWIVHIDPMERLRPALQLAGVG